MNNNTTIGTKVRVPPYSITGTCTGDVRTGDVIGISYMKTAPSEVACVLSVNIGDEVHEYFASMVEVQYESSGNKSA